ncbi:PVC-type heme-binding CxxCH protein [Symmachiella dynata]|uniref:PVC-type heme-binding CxxCH protein n=1 Tax=Symmachiella dynata TaxID=2527995 RepID=UPI0030EDE2A6
MRDNWIRITLFLTLVSSPGVLFSQGYSPQEAEQRMTTADGLKVELVASEPFVRQPVAIEFDDRGRLWVIQYLQYPNPEGLKRVKVDRYSRTKYDRVPKPPPFGPKGADRITILEDSDGDGRMDGGRDFVNGLNLATGLAFGHGGVFVLNVPYLLFYPDRDRDDVPDGDPEVLLTGFGMEDAHSVANSLTWGPDGWLYGCQGSTVTAHIRGIEFQQGVWRYHPTSHKFELFCEGGGNSWGLDFDRTGELFYSTNYGGYVLLHGVQGGYFVKSFGKHGQLHNPFAYGYFDHASHENFQGGHVTVGGIVYQANTLPTKFRNTYIAGDLLGHNIGWHRIQRTDSTVRTEHGGELLTSHDNWFAPTDVTTGPDGAIYITDWADQRTAHPDPDADWDRSNGRIYRIAPRKMPEEKAFDLAKLDTAELLQLHSHSNQWYVRRARQELVRREDRSLIPEFRKKAMQGLQEIPALEALWSLHALGGFDDALAQQLLNSPHAAVRKWTIRLLGDGEQVSTETAYQLDELAQVETDVTVRNQLACTAARLPADQAMPIINANIITDIDADDPRIPLLWWWAVEQHSVSGRDEVLQRFTRPSLWNSKLGRETLLPRLIRRYTAEATSSGWDAVVQLLNSAPDQSARLSLWKPIWQGWQEQAGEEAEQFRRDIAPAHPLAQLVRSAWTSAPADSTLTRLAIALGYDEPVEAVRLEAFNSQTDDARRVTLLGVLAQTNDPALIKPALELLDSPTPEAIQRAALELLARFEDPDLTDRLLDLHQSTTSATLQSKIRDVLFGRVSSATRFLDAVVRGDVAPSQVPLEQVRRLVLLNDEKIDSRVTQHWGQLSSGSRGEVLAEIRRLNNDLRASAGSAKDGRLVFNKHCAACHQLFGAGKKLGPDLTTANRQDRDFLLASLVDPSNVIRKEFVSVIVQTTDGRVMTGLPISRDANQVMLVDPQNKSVSISTSEIEELQESPVSLMPDNLYRQLSAQELRDLFAYLQSNGEQ